MTGTIKRIVGFVLLAALCLCLFGCGADGSTFPRGAAPAEVPAEDFADSYTDALPENAEDGLTLHAFNWSYHDVLINLENIQNAGFKNVLLMPVQQPKSGGAAWWTFYQPLSFSIGDDSPLGSKDELIALCEEAEQ